MKYTKIDIEIETPHKAPYFLGSALRGAFGYALKKVVCINPSYKCEGCFASSSCLYYEFYEAQNSYHTYRFTSELGDGRFDFSLYLFDESCEKLPYIISALHKMLTEVGLMRDALKFDLFTMSIADKLIYSDGEFHLDAIKPQSFTPMLTSDSYDVTLELSTPLRIKKNNKFLRDDIDLSDILRSVHQREQQLCYGESYSKLEYTPSYTTVSKQLHYKTLIRKSNRQKSKMNMDGIMGQLTLTNLDPTSYRLLKLGEILGVGKQTVMGLGSIRLT